MWYVHQILSGPFLVGVIGNVTAAVAGFAAGLVAAHWLYDLRKIHKAIGKWAGKRRLWTISR